MEGVMCMCIRVHVMVTSDGRHPVGLQEDLVERRQEMLKNSAEDIYLVEELKDYKKVRVAGEYAHEKSLFVGPRPRRWVGGWHVASSLYSHLAGLSLLTPCLQPHPP